MTSINIANRLYSQNILFFAYLSDNGIDRRRRVMSVHEILEATEVNPEAGSGHLDEALEERAVEEYEEVIELWKTHGGD